ncbi:hypothetical protein HMPREF0321_2017 [Dermacoccus sp. Ellin185]|nr:hypothetical protein HMPREF0321_2017 [Dermacoccus sp. Ellin185]
MGWGGFEIIIRPDQDVAVSGGKTRVQCCYTAPVLWKDEDLHREMRVALDHRC